MGDEFCFDTKNTMASAKKRRGRERKAARKKDNNDGARTDCSNDVNRELSSIIISDLRLI